MFEQALILNREQKNQHWSLFLSFTGQALILGTAVFLSMWYTDSFPVVMHFTPVTAPAPFVPKQPTQSAAPRNSVSHISVQVPRIVFNLSKPRSFAAPSPMDPAPQLDHVGSGGIGPVGGILSDTDGGMTLPPPPPVKPVEAKPVPPSAPVRLTSTLLSAKLIKQVIPQYPPIAKTTRTQGTVHLMCIVSREGRVKELQAVDGSPLLIPAALAAVSQWIYSPTILNHEPVEVVAPIEVRFVLSQ